MPRFRDYEVFTSGRVTRVERETVAVLIPGQAQRKTGARRLGVLIGVATNFLKPHHGPKSNMIEVFQKTSFDKALAAGAGCSLYVDHNPIDGVLAAGSDVTLLSTDNSLIFSVDLDDVAAGQAIADAVRGGRQECSVGYHIDAEETKAIGEDATPVRFINAATLFEISLCKAGAVGGTWCSIIQAQGYFDLRHFWKSGAFSAEHAAAKLRAALRELAVA